MTGAWFLPILCVAGSRVAPSTVRALSGIGFLMFCILVGVAALGFWGWTLGEVIAKEREDGSERMTWLVVVLATGLLGAVLYRVVRRPERIRESGN